MTNTDKPFRFKDNQPITWFHKNKAQSNQYCLYCHRQVSVENIASDKEHLIGRSFVPDGSLDEGRAFNFIFRACTECNKEKAEAERHISSVTLFTSPSRIDEKINALANRKAERDFHPIQQGKLVKDAFLEISVGIDNGPISAEYGLIGPPQLDQSYVRLLAFRHIQGFFSLITSTDPRTPEGTTLLPIEHWWFGGSYPHSDWGNVCIQEITKRIETWDVPLKITTADGFFKIIIRSAPHAGGPWFWALEWNKNLRLFGGIFDIKNPPVEFKNLPIPEKIYLKPDLIGYREIPLEDYEDKLFNIPLPV